jgi:5-methylcytosine-specific restriction endonuclease McrA
MATRSEHSARPNRESLSKRLGRVAQQIKARGNHECVYCGATAQSSGAHLHLDHVLPKTDGGKDVAENLVVSCRPCNSARHDMPIATWCRLIGVDVRRVRRQAARALQVSL